MCKNKRDSKLIAFGIIVALILLGISVCHVGAFYNDSILSLFSQQLYNCSLPDETIIIDKQKTCGKLNGNGDGMDFLSCILVKSEKTLDELKEHFERIKFNGAKLSSSDVEVQVVKVTSNKLQTNYLEHREVTFNVDIGTNDNYYAVIIYDGGYWNFFDLRGA